MTLSIGNGHGRVANLSPEIFHLHKTDMSLKQDDESGMIPSYQVPSESSRLARFFFWFQALDEVLVLLSNTEIGPLDFVEFYVPRVV